MKDNTTFRKLDPHLSSNKRVWRYLLTFARWKKRAIAHNWKVCAIYLHPYMHVQCFLARDNSKYTDNGKVFLVPVMEAKGVEVLLIWTLYNGEWTASSPGCVSIGSRDASIHWTVWRWALETVWVFWRRENFLVLPEFKPRFNSNPARSPVTLLATMSGQLTADQSKDCRLTDCREPWKLSVRIVSAGPFIRT
jgi:hypothetical protein